jgi:Flp pilus assembly secretin CpaC
MILGVCWMGSVESPQAQTGEPGFDPLGEFDDLPKQVRVQVEFVELAHEQLTELMLGTEAPANDAALREQVTKLVRDGKATILETLMCVSRTGQKATTESVEEYIYPTEYEPAEAAGTIEVNGDSESEAARKLRRDSAIGPAPTAFETRNLGATLEIEPTLSSDGKIIDLRFVPEIVYHVGNQVWAEWKGEHGNSPIQMPTFYTLRLTTAVTLADGKPILAAALSPKGADGAPDFKRKLMVFVRADVVSVGR